MIVILKEDLIHKKIPDERGSKLCQFSHLLPTVWARIFSQGAPQNINLITVGLIAETIVLSIKNGNSSFNNGPMIGGFVQRHSLFRNCDIMLLCWRWWLNRFTTMFNYCLQRLRHIFSGSFRALLSELV